jgi:hypothetical protein
MVTTRQSYPVQDNAHEEARHPNLGRDDAHEEAEFAGPEDRIAQLSQQLAQAQKNVEDLLAQNALLHAARTPPPIPHLEQEENNPDAEARVEHPEGSRERVEPWAEKNVMPANTAPPQQTEAEKRLQWMVLDLGAKYDALSRTMDQKRDGKESLVENLFQSKDSIFTDEVSNFDLPRRFKVPYISVFFR